LENCLIILYDRRQILVSYISKKLGSSRAIANPRSKAGKAEIIAPGNAQSAPRPVSHCWPFHFTSTISQFVRSSSQSDRTLSAKETEHRIREMPEAWASFQITRHVPSRCSNRREVTIKVRNVACPFVDRSVARAALARPVKTHSTADLELAAQHLVE